MRYSIGPNGFHRPAQIAQADLYLEGKEIAINPLTKEPYVMVGPFWLQPWELRLAD